MNNIPSVDLRDFLSNNLEKKERFIQTIGGAFQDIGFCAVRGHFLSDQKGVGGGVWPPIL